LGGTLVEFSAVPHGSEQARRLIDATILPDQEKRRVGPHERSVSISGQNVIVVQAKASRIGMYLLGQPTSRSFWFVPGAPHRSAQSRYARVMTAS
jgi:hypothetical protein